MFWDFFWLLVWSFFMVMYLMILFQVIKDIFRDNTMNGWLKALWFVFLLVAPFLSLLIYTIARGRGMAERQAAEMRGARAEADEYIQAGAGRRAPAEEIASAKNLLESGVIDEAEFGRLKEKALA